MHYFKNNKNFEIVTRKFEFTAESLDGTLIKIEPTEPCFLLLLTPTPLWNFSAAIIKEDTCDSLFETEEINQEEVKDPKNYKKVILKKDLDAYLELTGYVFAKKTFHDKKIEAKKIEPNVLPLKKTKLLNKTTEVTTPTEVSYLLSRDNEPSVYKFKSPNQR